VDCCGREAGLVKKESEKKVEGRERRREKVVIIYFASRPTMLLCFCTFLIMSTGALSSSTLHPGPQCYAKQLSAPGMSRYHRTQRQQLAPGQAL